MSKKNLKGIHCLRLHVPDDKEREESSAGLLPCRHAAQIQYQCLAHLMSASLQIPLEICDFLNIKKTNLQATVGGLPDLPGSDFNLYTACLYQKRLEPKNILAICCSL